MQRPSRSVRVTSSGVLSARACLRFKRCFLLNLDELLRNSERSSPAKYPTDQLLFRHKLSAARAAFADI